MEHFFKLSHPWPQYGKQLLGWAVRGMSALAVCSVQAAPPVALASEPLFSTASVDKPALVLALSVEFPTVGAQYVKNPGEKYDDSYSNTKEYLGYYDAESCYKYNDNPGETPATDKTLEDYKRFDRFGPATSRQCDNEFSGNFLNWASSSAIDMLRLSLTGGDRYIDIAAKGDVATKTYVPALTILQRAVIPNGDPICMWGSSNFPLKRLVRGDDDSYFKAVPKMMRTEAKNNKGFAFWTNGDIWVANTLNRIYFGTDRSSGNDCGLITRGPNTYYLGSSPPASNSKCSDEDKVCKVTGDKVVWYGSGENWLYKYVDNKNISCSNDTFGSDPRRFFPKNCYTKTTSEILNGSGFFYSRVQVCNANDKGELQDDRDYGLCKKYPNGSLKPTGAIQKYSNQLRLAAFGYLLDQTTARYGGVLRAPMKYVGAKTFDINGTESNANARQEWDAGTGVFVKNPENTDGFTYSGVVNYLNLFGRTGSEPGVYKKYDPVGELHYEALRYLQGLPPSDDAIHNIKPAMQDGFPVITSWTDPYAGRPKTGDYSCLKSNIVVIGDTNTWDGGDFPAPDLSKNIPDIAAWRDIVKDFELNKSTNYVDGSGKTRTTGNPNGAASAVPNKTDRSQIIGTAYWARTHDIRGTNWTATGAEPRPGLRAKTFVFDVNEYAQQKNDAKRRTDQLFLAAKYGGFETDSSNLNKNPFNTWGNPFRQEDGTPNNFVWQDTDTRANRRGEANTYFLQSDARGVLSAFDDIFRLAATASRSIAGSAIQGQNLTKEGGFIYQAAFDTADWSGDLLATAINVDATNKVSVNEKPTWSAADQLSALPKPAESRNIVVGNAGQSATVAVPFKWKDISESLKKDLNKASSSASPDNLGEARLNYIRGDNSKEGSLFRVRSRLLGDIINSGVVYSGVPTPSISAAGYAKFYSENINRLPAVYVGANDGMLHAFDAKTGDELFAYIPSWMGSRLSALSAQGYAMSHQSYVDATPAVAEAQLGADWKTVLVSGTGAGGRGVFALNVSDPVKFDAGSALWEFTDKDDTDMGNVVGKPRILKFEETAGVYKWYAVVGGGVNNDSGTGVLFMLDLAKPAGKEWELDKNYYKIILPVMPEASVAAAKPNGLINFQITYGAANQVYSMYMGDLHGNLWKLNFKSIFSNKWNINFLSAFNKGTPKVPSPYPLYTAKDDAGNLQPITVAPTISYGAKVNTSIIYFGTGRYLENGDIASTVQSAYMLYDNGTAKADASPIKSAISGRGRLQKGTATALGVVSVPEFMVGRPDKNIDRTKDNPIAAGWFFDFPENRERQITSASLLGDTLNFGTLIPALSGSSGSCNVSGGTGKQYSVSILTGTGEFNPSKVGILGDTIALEVVSARKYKPKDSTGKIIKSMTTQTLQQGSEGVAPTGEKTTDTIAGRLSWRQIHNYQELRSKP